MFKTIQVENTIKNIVRDTTRKCADKGINVTDILAQYVVKLISLNPDCGFMSDHKAQDIAENLVQICVNKLCEETPSLATLKMQILFDTNFQPRANLISKNCTKRRQRAVEILKEISEATSRTKDALKKIYRRIVITLIVYTGLGSPMNPTVLQETSDALQSVFPLSELEKFLCLPHKEKEHQIVEFAHIVAGIRLFNKDSDRGGEGIENLPVIIRETVMYLQENLQKSLHHLMELIYLLTLAVENSVKKVSTYKCENIKESEEGNESGNDPEKTKNEENISKSTAENSNGLREEELHNKDGQKSAGEHIKEDVSENQDNNEEEPNSKMFNDECFIDENALEVTWEDFELIKDSLIAARQHEVYLRKLLKEVDTTYFELKKWNQIHIHDTVKFSTTDDIYPHLIKLSEAWISLQDEKNHLDTMKFIYWNLHGFMKILETLDQNLLYTLAGDSPVISDAGRLQETTGLHIDPSMVKCEVIDHTKVQNFEQIPIQYLGFCAGMLVLGKGALIPGNPNMGLCHWKDSYYAFSSLEQAYAFGNNPDTYVDAAIELARSKPELIGLLQLQDQITIRKYKPYDLRMEPRGSKAIIKRHCSVQTELHPVPTYIDSDYMWNEWDLKRNAVKLANICRSATHSTQTYLSHKRSTIAIQTTNKKAVSCQTKRDGSSNVPTLGNFIFGLRGRTDSQQYLLTLTRPPNE